MKIDPKYDAAAREFLIHDLAHRVTRISFGDAAAKERDLAEDHQLSRALELLKQSATQAQLLAATATPRKVASRQRAVCYLGDRRPSFRTAHAPPARSAHGALLHPGRG